MKTVIFFICLFFVHGVFAQTSNNDGDNLYVYLMGSSNPMVYSLENLEKLTFEESAVKIWNDGGHTDFEYGKILLMTFRKDIKPTSSIESLNIDVDGAKIIYERSSSMLRVECGQILQGLAVYDIQGRLVSRDARKLSSYRISLQGKPQGVYFIKIGENGKSTRIKIVK